MEIVEMYFIVSWSDEYGREFEKTYQSANRARAAWDNIPARAKSKYMYLFTETTNGRNWQMIISEE